MSIVQITGIHATLFTVNKVKQKHYEGKLLGKAEIIWLLTNFSFIYENYHIIAYVLSPMARKAKVSHFAIIIACLAKLVPSGCCVTQHRDVTSKRSVAMSRKKGKVEDATAYIILTLLCSDSEKNDVGKV